ncbi:hypothetical protein IMSAGC008_02388 [Muribaculaceae bacterium]|nr:hypothetical protein IMSAGC008_02388 [Muribaculaceae bacterium]
MRLMPVLRIFVGPVVVPLLQVAVLTYLVWIKLGKHPVDFGAEPAVKPQNHSSGASVRKALAHHGEICGTAVESGSDIAVRRHIGIFGRRRRRSHEMAVFLHKPAEAKIGSTFQHRVIFFEETFILIKHIVLPYVACEPSSSHIPVGPDGGARVESYRVCHSPYVGIMPKAPTALNPEIMFRCQRTTL